MPPVCVLVMGGPRAGTSLCAGVLHRLGVHMGDDLGDANEWNPLGFYEDGEFSDIYSRMVCGDGPGSMENYMPESASLTDELRAWHSRLIEARIARGMPWGVKSARLCYTLPEFPEPMKVIRMLRPESEMVASWQARSSVSEEAAKATIKNAIKATDAAVKGYKPAAIEVQYHDLIDHREKEISRIAEFVGLPVTSDAVGFIDPTLRRFRDA